MNRTAPQDEIEIAIGPRPARREWSVLRVTYQRKPEHELRVARAVSALFPEERLPGPTHEHNESPSVTR